MYVCVGCIDENHIDIRFVKDKFRTMCENCHEIKVCYVVDIKLFIHQNRKVVKNNNVSYLDTN